MEGGTSSQLSETVRSHGDSSQNLARQCQNMDISIGAKLRSALDRADGLVLRGKRPGVQIGTKSSPSGLLRGLGSIAHMCQLD